LYEKSHLWGTEGAGGRALRLETILRDNGKTLKKGLLLKGRDRSLRRRYRQKKVARKDIKDR